MSQHMYDASTKIFIHNLKNISTVLKIAAKDAKARGIDPAVLLNSRLAPDMLPLIRQVQMTTDHAKGASARLAGIEPPVFKDEESTFAELEARLKATISFVRQIKVAQFEGSDTRDICMEFPVGKISFSGADYLNGFALPNFYFHYGAIYNILRHNGVSLGKGDFLGKVPGATATGKIAKMMGLKPASKSSKKRRN